MDLIEQKPENKKDLVKMLEVVKDCRTFDAYPPLDEDGVASSSDHVNRTKRGFSLCFELVSSREPRGRAPGDWVLDGLVALFTAG